MCIDERGSTSCQSANSGKRKSTGNIYIPPVSEGTSLVYELFEVPMSFVELIFDIGERDHLVSILMSLVNISRK